MPKGSTRFKDLTGVRFGYSVVLELLDRGGSGKHSQWKCLCDCGQPHKKNSSYINATINNKPKHFGSCNSHCAEDLNKRKQIQENLVVLEILAEELEEKWGIEIGVGTLRQAEDNNWEFYLTGDECINGHIDAKATNRRQCLQCRYNESRSKKAKERGKQWRENNQEYTLEYGKIYYEENAEKIRKRASDWIRNNPERVRERQQQTRSTPEGRLLHNLRNRVNKIMKRIDVVKDSTTLDLLGCDAVKAKEHIQSQFTEGMSWENYGDWDVDHIKPCAAFDLIDPEEQKKHSITKTCNLYGQHLRPL